jgi:transposase
MEVLHPHCAGLDVHKETVVACVRHVLDGTVKREVRTFKTMTRELMALSEWLSAEGCTHIAMEGRASTGSRCGTFWRTASLNWSWRNAAHVKNLPGRKTDVNDAT